MSRIVVPACSLVLGPICRVLTFGAHLLRYKNQSRWLKESEHQGQLLTHDEASLIANTKMLKLPSLMTRDSNGRIPRRGIASHTCSRNEKIYQRGSHERSRGHFSLSPFSVEINPRRGPRSHLHYN